MADVALVAAPPHRSFVADALRRHPTAIAGAVLLLLMIALAVLAPFLWTVDPQALSPIRRLRPPSERYWFGTDMLGRDVWSRTIYGARVSLIVGLSVAQAKRLAQAGLRAFVISGNMGQPDTKGRYDLPPDQIERHVAAFIAEVSSAR